MAGHDARSSALGHLRAYGWGGAGADLRAGAAVGAVLVPMGMTYAVLAGVPPVHGLYASLVPLLVYPIFAASRHLSVGPAAVDMVVVAGGLGALAASGSDEYVALAALTALFVGGLHLAVGAARLDGLVRLLSRPVVVGFMTAAPVVIAASQLGALVGLDLPRDPLGASATLVRWIGEAHSATVLAGAMAVALLVGLRRWRRVPGPLVVVVAGAAVSWVAGLEAAGVAVIGPVPPGLPRPALPVPGPELWAAARAVAPTALALALVQLLGVVSLSQAFADRFGTPARPMRDVLAVGAANVAGGLFGAVPVAASFSRSAVNVEAGAASAASNAVAASVVALALVALTPAFAPIPQAVLAAVIVVAALGLIEPRAIPDLLRAHRRDGVVAVVTAAVTLLVGIQEGLLVGVAVSVLGLLREAGRADVAVLTREPGTRAYRDAARTPGAEGVDELVLLRPRSALSFANAERFAARVQEEVRQADARAVVLDLRDVADLDATAAAVLDRTAARLESGAVRVYLVSATPTGPLERGGAGRHRWVPSVREAVDRALAGSGEGDEPAVASGGDGAAGGGVGRSV